MRAVMKKVAKEERKDAVTGGDSAVMMGGGKLNSDLNQNTKFLLNEYDKLGMRRDQLMAPHVNNLNNVVANTAPGHGYYNGPFPSSNHHSGGGDASTNPLAALGNAVQEAGTPLGYGALLGAVGHKPNLNQPFLGDAKPAKVRKKKPGLDLDRKSPKYGDDVVIDLDERSSDSYLGEGVPAIVDNMKRRDVKLQTIFNKRRSSSDSGTTDIATTDLAALREQVYGAANAATFAKINSYSHKDNKDIKKVKKPRTDGPDSRKSPIVLDLTETESSSKKSGSSSGSSSSHSSSSLSAALLKRPGIEIIPIPGSTTPISIPSSITVTPVIKSADDKNKDKKDRRDKKDLDRKDKKRKRDDSPSSNSSSSSSSSSSKPSKVQIISSNLKHSPISSLEKFKSESGSKSGLTGITVKPSTPPYQSPSKKPSLSPGMTKSMIHNKLSVSPTHKPNKVIYSPNQSSSSHSSSPKGRSSPKPSTGSPKHPSMSPKHTSLGKPSMTQLKSASPTFSKPSLSPKLSKSKDKERSSSSSPSRPLPSSSSSSSSSMSSSSSSSSSSSLSKPKVSSSSSSSGTEKLKSSLSDALTITKVSTGESSSSSSLATSFLANSQSNTSSTSMDEKAPSFPVDKAKASPPKNRKGSSLSDIVDKLRAGVGGTADAVTIIEKNEKDDKDSSKTGAGEGKKTGDKKEEFTVKPSTGLKLTINKAKMKEGNLSKSSSSSSPNAKPSLSKSPSGLKPGVISGPASKKSISSLPPIPKLPPSSVSNVTATAVSPLGTTLPGVHSSPLQYQRERVKDKDREKDRSSSGERPRPKETSPAKSLNNSSSDGKKDSPSNKTSLTKPVSKDDHSLSQVSSHRKLESSESIDKLSKSVFQNESGDKIEKSSTTKAEADSTHSTSADSSVSNKLSDSFSEKGGVGHHNSLASSNKLSTPVSSLSSGTQAAPSSSSDMIRQRDVFQQPQFKPSKEAKEDTKPKSDIPLPLPRPSVSSSSSGALATSDHLPSDPVPSLTPTSSSTSLNSSIPPPRQPPPPHSASNKAADGIDHNTGSSLDLHDKSKSSESLVSSMPGPPPSSLAMSQPPPPKTTTPTVGYPPSSPSMSFKIVKSPAPVASPLNMISPHPVASPLNMISPHSVASSPSSCIIDDDLMDEALMGTRK